MANAGVNGLSEFSWQTFQEVGDVQKNISYSPYSTAKALELLSLGTTGATRAQLDSLLKEEPLSVPKTSVAKLKLANSFWADNSLPVKASFTQKIDKEVKAVSQTVPFLKDPKLAADKINAWVKEQTEGLIPQILTADTCRDLLAVLANALYVKGRWKEDGDTLSVEKKPFSGINKNKKTIDFLEHNVDYRFYVQDKGVQIVEVPLARGELIYGIILPDAKVDFLNWRRQLKRDQIHQWMASLQKKRTQIWHPKFTIKSNFQLSDFLIKKGFAKLFEANKDYSPITDQAMKLSKVFQDTVFKLDEQGVEAAAVTYMGMEGAGMMRDKTPIMEIRADRPHLFYLTTSDHKHILFLGQYVLPE